MAVYSGGVPMVKIDGTAIRALREEKGLTQLYLASAVGVTTDTISRWENKRYPQIKKENALKLAEVLEVPVEDILDQHEEQSGQLHEVDSSEEAVPQEQEDQTENGGSAFAPSSPQMPDHWKTNKYWALFFLVVVLAGLFFLRQPVSRHHAMAAVRVVPDHIVVGQPFPVVISVDIGQDPSSFILRETIPAQCQLVDTKLPNAIIDEKSGEIKWIAKPKSGVVRVGYMLLVHRDTKPSQKIQYAGSITNRRANGKADRVIGQTESTISNFHWADVNQDGAIDDEEILTVYDDYDEIDGLSVNMEKIEDIWFGSGYRWDEKKNAFEIFN